MAADSGIGLLSNTPGFIIRQAQPESDSTEIRVLCSSVDPAKQEFVTVTTYSRRPPNFSSKTCIKEIDGANGLTGSLQIEIEGHYSSGRPPQMAGCTVKAGGIVVGTIKEISQETVPSCCGLSKRVVSTTRGAFDASGQSVMQWTLETIKSERLHLELPRPDGTSPAAVGMSPSKQRYWYFTPPHVAELSGKKLWEYGSVTFAADASPTERGLALAAALYEIIREDEERSRRQQSFISGSSDPVMTLS